jgi:hypothetical protein
VSLHCACALRLPDIIYITTPASIDDGSDIKTELVAPEASSLSQFYQQHHQQQPQQNYQPHINYFHQQPTIDFSNSPFLYTGPLIISEDQGRSFYHPSEPRNTEKSSPNQEKSSYELYRPSIHDHPQFMDMLPPSQDQDETNYYAIKPKKIKKYLAKTDGEKKKKTKKSKKNLKDKIVKMEEIDNNEAPSDEKQKSNLPEIEISSKLTNDSQARRQRETENTEDYENEDEPFVEKSAPTSRLDFAMHGN